MQKLSDEQLLDFILSQGRKAIEAMEKIGRSDNYNKIKLIWLNYQQSKETTE
ncbi:MAG: hypothetical protein PHW03_05330 [Eubacteriales bacterium]|nr:hypothetical protein [Eubacteriales bacterium]